MQKLSNYIYIYIQLLRQLAGTSLGAVAAQRQPRKSYPNNVFIVTTSDSETSSIMTGTVLTAVQERCDLQYRVFTLDHRQVEESVELCVFFFLS